MTAVAADRGVRVLVGGCVALGAESLPYAPFAQALEALTAPLGARRVEELIGRPARIELARLVLDLRDADYAALPGAPAIWSCCSGRY